MPSPIRKWLAARTGKALSPAERSRVRIRRARRIDHAISVGRRQSDQAGGESDRRRRPLAAPAPFVGESVPEIRRRFLGSGADRQIPRRRVRPARHRRQRLGMDRRLLARQLHARAVEQSCLGQSGMRARTSSAAARGAARRIRRARRIVWPRPPIRAVRASVFASRAICSRRQWPAPAAPIPEPIRTWFCVACSVSFESRSRAASSATVWHVVRRNRLPG